MNTSRWGTASLGEIEYDLLRLVSTIKNGSWRFETDKPEDFLDLVMALRETEGSRYTLRDTPIFTASARA